jgi:hypothetical protein
MIARLAPPVELARRYRAFLVSHKVASFIEHLKQDTGVKRIGHTLASVASSVARVYGMFGHVDAGVLHVRPALDMKAPAQSAMARPGSRTSTVGCCGMPGTYGHETANRATSERIFDLSWRKIIATPTHLRPAIKTRTRKGDSDGAKQRTWHRASALKNTSFPRGIKC